MSTTTVFLLVLGVILLLTLIVLAVRMRGVMRQDTSSEPGAQTWSAAVPWLIGLGLLILLLLGAYYLTR